MSIVLQHRRGTTAQHATFTGAAGEVTFDTTKKTLVAHDGLTAGGIPLAKETALLFPGIISGLTGESESSAPTTKFNLRADSVTTRNASGNTRTYFNVTSKQVDLTLANSIGGRDQVAAFTAFAEPNLFWVPDGSGGLGLVLSLNGPNTGPTGYAEWALAANLKLNGSAQFVQGTVVANKFILASPGVLVNLATASFPTVISHSTLVPLAASEFYVHGEANIQTGVGGASARMNLGSASTSLASATLFAVQPSDIGGGWIAATLAQTAARTLAYGVSAQVNISAYSQTVAVGWYTMRNGAL